MRESQIEAYLIKRVKELGGDTRKIEFIGRRGAPDRVVFFNNGDHTNTLWLEVKNPETIKTFPSNAHERAQAREHARMRALGQRVEVVGTIEQIDELFS